MIARHPSSRAAWRTEFGAVATLAAPLILSNLTMALMQATDVVLMGRLSPDALAASALGANLAMPLTVSAMGLGLAAAPMISTALGRRANAVRDVRRTFRQSVWALMTVIVPIWLILWNIEPILHALHQDADLARGAAAFMRGYQWSVLPFLLFQAMRNFVSALQRPGWVLMLSIGGIGLNFVLGYALIFGVSGFPRWGLYGGGIATTIVWSLMTAGLAVVIATDHQFRRFHLFGCWWRADWPRYWAIWQLGLPIALTFLFEAAVFGAAIFLMGLIDTVSVAAHAIALQIASLAFMVPLGIGQAATVRVGLAVGRRDAAGIGRAGWTALATGTGFMGITASLIWLLPHTLVGLFVDAGANPRVTMLAVQFLGVAAVFQVLDGAQVVGAGMLRGLHDTRAPMLIAGFGYWVIGIGVGSGLAFGAGWQGIGIWYGLAAGLGVVAALLIARWTRRDRFLPQIA